MTQLFIIDDDLEFCNLLAEFLRFEQYQVTTFQSAEAALQVCTAAPPDLIILDVMMPGMDGLTFLKTLRQTQQIPVIVLTARGDDVDSIVGLELGADDYLAKPFNPKVLLARIRATLRRHDLLQSATPNRELVQQVGTLQLHRGKRTLSEDQVVFPLTSTEFSLVEYLVREVGTAVPKSELYERVLGRPFEKNDRSLDMHISNLRSKLGSHGNSILTVRGSGYQWAID